MLNEMISGQCPVCGRYYYEHSKYYWCPYCGPSLSDKAIRDLKKLTNRVDIIEALLKWNEIRDLED